MHNLIKSNVSTILSLIVDGCNISRFCFNTMKEIKVLILTRTQVIVSYVLHEVDFLVDDGLSLQKEFHVFSPIFWMNNFWLTLLVYVFMGIISFFWELLLLLFYQNNYNDLLIQFNLQHSPKNLKLYQMIFQCNFGSSNMNPIMH